MTLGVLLVNLGTPDAPTTSAVRRYLREFLSDPRVIDAPALVRWLLLNLIILPFRPKQSAAAYKAVWTKQGSPLMVYSVELKNAVQQALSDTAKVELAMRYGSLSIENGVLSLERAGVDELIILPLYPQYASATTGSSLEEVFRCLSRRENIPAIHVVKPFYDDPRFVHAAAAIAESVIEADQPDFVLMSYHGLPERQVQKSGCGFSAKCKAGEPCPGVSSANQYCYRAHCYATSRALARALNLNDTQYKTSFQSRLGRIPWIQPYTDQVLETIYAAGHRRLGVMCPSFTADCLETLEEIGMQLQDAWQALGGESFTLIPCVNASPAWVDAVASMVNDHDPSAL